MATDIILRSVKAAALTYAEMDQNWESLAQTIDAITASATVLITDQNKILECDIASGTMTLPTVVNAAGTDTDSFQITFKNINATALTISGNGGELIEGQNTFTLAQNDVANLALSGDSTSWIYKHTHKSNLQGVTATAAEINNICGGNTLSGSGTVIDNFDSGTTMTFQQATAPTGWTRDVVSNDRVLRVVSGALSSGGATPFSVMFGTSKVTDDHTLLTAEIAIHTHTGTTANEPPHFHEVLGYDGSSANFNGLFAEGSVSATGNTLTTGTGGSHTHTFTTAPNGGSQGHNHQLLNFDLQYTDVMLAVKD